MKAGYSGEVRHWLAGWPGPPRRNRWDAQPCIVLSAPRCRHVTRTAKATTATGCRRYCDGKSSLVRLRL